MIDPILSIQQPNEAGIFIHPLQVWKPGLREGVHSRLVLGHQDHGLPTFPFMANPTPERPGLCSSTQPGLLLSQLVKYYIHGEVLLWVVLFWLYLLL